MQSEKSAPHTQLGFESWRADHLPCFAGSSCVFPVPRSRRVDAWMYWLRRRIPPRRCIDDTTPGDFGPVRSPGIDGPGRKCRSVPRRNCGHATTVCAAPAPCVMPAPCVKPVVVCVRPAPCLRPAPCVTRTACCAPKVKLCVLQAAELLPQEGDLRSARHRCRLHRPQFATPTPHPLAIPSLPPRPPLSTDRWHVVSCHCMVAWVSVR